MKYDQLIGLFIGLFLIALAGKGQDRNLSKGRFFDGEPTSAINPNNPGHLVVA